MPLVFFYEQLGLDLPPVAFIEGSTMPEPQRHLLVHASDMTPRLRQHHGCAPLLRVVSAQRTEDLLNAFRKISDALNVLKLVQ